MAPVVAHRVVLLAVALTLLTVGCRVEVLVGVEVEEDGTGLVRVAVRLDEDAARRVPRLADQLELDDLVAAGWTVRGPREEGDGGTWVRLSKRFASPSGAGEVLDEVSGPDGPFGDLTLERDRSVVARTWRFHGSVDLRDRLESFGDRALRERLRGSSFGWSEDELERRAGRPLEEALRVEVSVDLPGSLSAEGAVRSGDVARWEPALGERLEVDATGRVADPPRLALLAVALSAVVALALVLLTGAVRRLRRPAAWTGPGTVRR
jgi:hypothetical protein